MNEILSQAEIEALLSSLATNEVTAEPDMPKDDLRPMRREDKKPVSYEIYDFRRPDKFSKDQLRTLQVVHETFARLLASSLSAYLRALVHLDLISVEQVPYDEYIRSLSNSVINIVSLPPLSGQTILEIDFDIIYGMIDRLLGGPGHAIKRSKDLTEIEKTITDTITGKALKELQTAWENIIEIQPVKEVMETSPQFVTIASPNEIVVSILFELKVGENRGAMSLCIPYLMLKPVMSKLTTQRWLANNNRQEVSPHSALLARRLRTTHIPCVVRLGTAKVTVEDFLNLQVGDTIRLDSRLTDPVNVMIGGKVKFLARPGVKDKKLAICVNAVVADEES
ncbi:MAG: flagellar motor switch protein FliM [Armatimonadetes bacterium]|nr:flagellar motor switch protein FliM [Armatimonadota bacterium]